MEHVYQEPIEDTYEDLVIPLGKTKIVLTVLGAFAFVVIGGWLVVLADAEPFPKRVLVKAVGIAGIAFFGLVFIFAFKKAFDRSPGMIVSSKGIFDNSSVMAHRFLVPWDQITGFSIVAIQGQRFLTVHILNPERYMNDPRFLHRIAIRANNKYFGSPVQLAANGLKTDFDEMVAVIERYFARYGRR